MEEIAVLKEEKEQQKATHEEAVNEYVFPSETCTDDTCTGAEFSSVPSDSKKKSLTWKMRFRT